MDRVPRVFYIIEQSQIMILPSMSAVVSPWLCLKTGGTNSKHYIRTSQELRRVGCAETLSIVHSRFTKTSKTQTHQT
jgi:hypothetical protein